jgi:hypothetical protein
MKIASARRTTALTGSALLVLLAAACGDSRVNALDLGIGKDSVLKIIGQGAPAGDSLPNVYQHMQFFIDSKLFDVYMYDPKNRDKLDDPLVTDKELTPIILVEGKLEGTGWKYADELTQQFKLPIRTPVTVRR